MSGWAEAYLLGFWLGDGSIHKRGAFFHVGTTGEVAFRQAYVEWSGEEPTLRSYRQSSQTCWSSRWGKRLRELGYDWPCRATDKAVRCSIFPFELSLLEGLWDTNGTIYVGPTTQNVRYGYCRSQKLVLQIIDVIARMGMEARVGSSRTKAGDPIWAANVLKRYHPELGRKMILSGRKAELLRQLV